MPPLRVLRPDRLLVLLLLVLVLPAAIEHLRELLPLARRAEVEFKQRRDRHRRRAIHRLLRPRRAESLVDLVLEALRSPGRSRARRAASGPGSSPAPSRGCCSRRARAGRRRRSDSTSWKRSCARCGIRILSGLTEMLIALFAAQRPRTAALCRASRACRAGCAGSRARSASRSSSSCCICRGERRVGRVRRIEDERAIVRVAVAVDVAGDARRDRRSRRAPRSYQFRRSVFAQVVVQTELNLVLRVDVVVAPLRVERIADGAREALHQPRVPRYACSSRST